MKEKREERKEKNFKKLKASANDLGGLIYAVL